MDTIVIVASLGRLKAYRVEETPTRGKKLDLVEDMEFIDAHGGLSDHVSDRSGRYPKVFSAGNPKAGHFSAFEGKTVALEIERRLIRTISEKITTILLRERPEAWYFAAGSEIFEALLEHIPMDLQERMTRTDRADLVKLPPKELLERFPVWSD